MRLPLKVAVGLTLFCAISAETAHAENCDQSLLNTALAGAERICLSGNELKFDFETNGDLRILRITPGVKGEIHLDRNQTYGATFFQDPAVRKLVEERIAACMERQWPQVAKFTCHPEPSTINFEKQGPNVNFDCEQWATSPVDYNAPDGYYISSVNLEVISTSNISTTSPPKIIKSPDGSFAHGEVSFRGLDKTDVPFVGKVNCPGGGHGGVRIYGVITKK